MNGLRLITLCVGLSVIASPIAHGVLAQPGVLDPTFGNGGVLFLEEVFPDLDDPSVHAVGFDPEGRPVAAGAHVTGVILGLPSLEPVVWRFLDDGTPDPAFAGDGASSLAIGAEVGIIYDIDLLPSGGAVAVGFQKCCTDVGDETGFVMRVGPNGSLDPVFGAVLLDSGVFYAVRGLSDDRVLALGGRNDCVAAQFMHDGAPDPTFGEGGAVAVASGPTDPSEGLFSACLGAAFDDGGRMLFATQEAEYINNRFERTWAVLRLFPDGSLDATFESVVRTDLAGLSSIAVSPDGRVTLGGEKFSGNATLARYTEDGALDASFGDFGVAELDAPVHSSSMALALQPDGKLLVGSGDWLARLLTDGTLDSAFGLDGVATLEIASETCISSLSIDTEGRVVVGGNGFIARLSGDGTVASEPSVRPEGLTLSAPAPNPVSERAALTYTLAASAPVRLVLYDVLGREVSVLAAGTRSAGRHDVAIDASHLATGLYVVRLTTGDEVATRRLTVIR